MRFAFVLTFAVLCGCASQRLALVPAPGVDLSGRWLLNDAESDDPLHLVQSQATDPSKLGPASQGQGGQAGRGGRQGGRGGMPGGYGGPAMPGVGVLGDALRWPGRDIEIKQVAGVVAISSGGRNRIYEPSVADHAPHHRRPPPDEAPGRDRDMPSRDRDGPPPRCGWDERTLVIQSAEADDDHPPFEERYSISADGQRLFETIGFKGGRSAGFTVSRVWDRQ